MNERYVTDLPPPMSLPQAKVATVQQYLTSAMFHTYNPRSEYMSPSHPRAMNRHQNNDVRYNIPLQERFN